MPRLFQICALTFFRENAEKDFNETLYATRGKNTLEIFMVKLTPKS